MLLYTLLYALNLTVINPWGETIGAIWTAPKVYTLIALLSLNASLLFRARRTLIFKRNLATCGAALDGAFRGGANVSPKGLEGIW